MPVSTLTAKYQATIPRQVREALQVSAGDRIEFLIDARYGLRSWCDRSQPALRRARAPSTSARR